MTSLVRTRPTTRQTKLKHRFAGRLARMGHFSACCVSSWKNTKNSQSLPIFMKVTDFCVFSGPLGGLGLNHGRATVDDSTLATPAKKKFIFVCFCLSDPCQPACLCYPPKQEETNNSRFASRFARGTEGQQFNFIFAVLLTLFSCSELGLSDLKTRSPVKGTPWNTT